MVKFNKKHAFWQALFLAIVFFGIGLMLGASFENSRNQIVDDLLISSEVNVLDNQLIADFSDIFNVSCDIAWGGVVDFADSIYEEARLLEDYDGATQLTDVLDVLHKKYDVLRMMVWSQSMKVKERCENGYHSVVYFYEYNEPFVTVDSNQLVFSRVLSDWKAEYGNKFVLIPIAGDMGLKSAEVAMKHYGIEKYPAVVIDEEIVITDVAGLQAFSGFD